MFVSIGLQIKCKLCIDMGWLDGMTGCGGECDIDSATVTMTNFQLTS